jgi:hypothetical protein
MWSDVFCLMHNTSRAAANGSDAILRHCEMVWHVLDGSWRGKEIIWYEEAPIFSVDLAAGKLAKPIVTDKVFPIEYTT